MKIFTALAKGISKPNEESDQASLQHASLINLRMDLHREAISSFAAEYDRSERIFISLDTKAQATAGIAGLFLAAIFAFTQQSAGAVDLLQVALMGAALALLVISVASSIFGMRIARVENSPDGAFFGDLLSDFDSIAEVDNDAPDLAIRMYGDLLARWAISVSSLHNVNEKKAAKIRLAQWTLVAAMFMVAAFVVIAINSRLE